MPPITGFKRLNENFPDIYKDSELEPLFGWEHRYYPIKVIGYHHEKYGDYNMMVYVMSSKITKEDKWGSFLDKRNELKDRTTDYLREKTNKLERLNIEVESTLESPSFHYDDIDLTSYERQALKRIIEFYKLGQIMGSSGSDVSYDIIVENSNISKNALKNMVDRIPFLSETRHGGKTRMIITSDLKDWKGNGVNW